MFVLRVYLQGERVGSYIYQYKIVLEGFKFSFSKWNSWLFLHGRIPCLQFTVDETKQLRTTKKSGVLTLNKYFLSDLPPLNLIQEILFMLFFLVDYEGFYGSTYYSPNISFFNFSFLSSICCGNLCGEREKNWNEIAALSNAPILDMSSDRDTNPEVQFLLIQGLSISQEGPHGHPFLSGVCDLIPKYSCCWEITSSALKSLQTCVEGEFLPTVTHLWKPTPNIASIQWNFLGKQQ